MQPDKNTMQALPNQLDLYLLVKHQRGNQHTYPSIELATQRIFASQEAALLYKRSKGDSVGECLAGAEVLRVPLVG